MRYSQIFAVLTYPTLFWQKGDHFPLKSWLQVTYFLLEAASFDTFCIVAPQPQEIEKEVQCGIFSMRWVTVFAVAVMQRVARFVSDSWSLLYFTACHNVITMYDDGLSGRGLMTSRRERYVIEQNNGKLGRDPVFRYFVQWPIFPFSSCRYYADRSTAYNWYVSNAAMTLATVLATIPVLFFWRYAPVWRAGTSFMLQPAGTDVEKCKSFSLKKTLSESSTVAQTAERFEPNTLLWTFHTIRLVKASFYLVSQLSIKL